MPTRSSLGCSPHRLAGVIALALATSGCASWRLDRAAQTATGFASHVLCDEVFISGLPAQRAFDERIRPLPGQGAVVWALAHRVDMQQQEVAVTLLGGFESRARYSVSHGCVALPASVAAAPGESVVRPGALPDLAGAAPVSAVNAALQAALERAVPVPQGTHRTRAVVVMHEGRLVGERYGQGIDVSTPLLGFSASKSVSNALAGILVRQGRLRLDQRGLLPAWQDSADPRHAITVEQLLRQTSGLDLVQDNSGFDTSSQIMYSVRDKAAAASAAGLAHTPGQRWAYADTNYLLLSRVMSDAVGGQAADWRRFMQDELFGPLGMHSMRMDLDATGTGIGASHVLATARDWARLGQLYLDDGMAAGRRILPEGWVKWSTTPTLATGYGAGWWTNQLPGHVPDWGVPWGLPQAPRDTFFARGYMGQFVVVVPSRRLVVVRLSSAPERGDDIEETDRIVAEILAATR
jgi:CubicO group peptidase (beta-lactamase class C family)